MLLKYRDKKKLVLDFKNDFKKSIIIFVLGFDNLSSNDLNFLRKSINQSRSKLVVARNNLFKLSIKNLREFYLSKYLTGPSMICYSFYSESDISVVLSKYLNLYKNKVFIRAISYKGKLLPIYFNSKIAKLNNVNKCLSYLVYYLKDITIFRFLKVLNVLKKINFK